MASSRVAYLKFLTNRALEYELAKESAETAPDCRRKVILCKGVVVPINFRRKLPSATHSSKTIYSRKTRSEVVVLAF